MANDVYKDPGDRGVNGWNTLNRFTEFDSGLSLGAYQNDSHPIHTVITQTVIGTLTIFCNPSNHTDGNYKEGFIQRFLKKIEKKVAGYFNFTFREVHR
jgi:hypothetical protein